MTDTRPNAHTTHSCCQCGVAVESLPTVLEYEGQDVHVFNPVVCRSCLITICQTHSVECANCGGQIPPYTQVGVLKADDGQCEYVHMTTACTTVGSAFHGYLGKGHLGDFVQVEAC
ncbi:hypothetical protein [Nitrospina watsonii]|uniref:Uncharacterized protein n=1 Tax=Nitrospina watsonii TaxID=1323948 RepID=A0ABM9HG40_9BACT|nr:hypothetical protein [Nitrospina watsonii]CAI2719285.1 conserved protein of unknown function [Nitrospina watsonii]